MPDARLLFLHALTGIHPGSGTALGVVDMPVQRERHTGWPVIPGSSIKGVLRDAFRSAGSSWTESLFGKAEVKDVGGHAGSLALMDAFMLAFPVRSMKGAFAWVTCPLALERLVRTLGLVGAVGEIKVPEVTGDDCLVADDGIKVLAGTAAVVVLEEYSFTPKGSCAALAAAIADMAFADADTCARFKKQLVVLSDTNFSHFVSHATEVTARIGLNPATKNVNKRELFYEEFLPAESLFASTALAQVSRAGGGEAAADLLGHFMQGLPAFVQVGGNETIGKGFCATKLFGGA